VSATDPRGRVWESEELTKWQRAMFAVLGEVTGMGREYVDRLCVLGNELAEVTGRRVPRLDARLQDSAAPNAVACRGESAGHP